MAGRMPTSFRSAAPQPSPAQIQPAPDHPRAPFGASMAGSRFGGEGGGEPTGRLRIVASQARCTKEMACRQRRQRLTNSLVLL